MMKSHYGKIKGKRTRKRVVSAKVLRLEFNEATVAGPLGQRKVIRVLRQHGA